uniref:Baseplate J like protein n=1 Tax=Siphoviridae sp. ctgn638 TaxID=2827913 RepID=A0A8S5TKQ7_9CAUD|nr:MAG TPA: Baseplate J like protein [Siphoviridae sp. ctgn638]
MTIEIAEKTDLEVSAELLANVPDKYQKNVGYFVWDLMLALGKVFVTLYEKLRYLSCFIADIRTLDYEDLKLFVFQRAGIEAKNETYATGLIKVVTGSGVITSGDIFETADGLQFKATETKEITEGETFTAECLISGKIGNVPVGAITQIPTTIQGIIAVTNELPFVGGYEAESKESIIERYYTKLRKPVSSGNKYHYEQWALECTGVGKVKVKPLWNGENTVKIIIADSNNEIASAELIETVQNYIDPYTLDSEGNRIGWGCGNGQAPIGAYCTVESGTAKEINVSVSVKLKIDATLETVKQNIQKALKEYFKSTVFETGAYISYARVNSIINNADGVEDNTNLLVNDSTENITISESDTTIEIATLGNLTVDLIGGE